MTSARKRAKPYVKEGTKRYLARVELYPHKSISRKSMMARMAVRTFSKQKQLPKSFFTKKPTLGRMERFFDALGAVNVDYAEEIRSRYGIHETYSQYKKNFRRSQNRRASRRA